MSKFDPTRDCPHGRQKGKCDSCDLEQAVDFIRQLQQRITELELRNNELAAAVERLRFIADTEYADEDERIADIQGVLEVTPRQNLAERDAEVARKAFIAGCSYGEKYGIFGRDRQADKYAQYIKGGDQDQ